MADKTFEKAKIVNGQILLADDGDIELPVPTALPHRFQIIDGNIVDSYDGITDDGVRLKDWEDAVAAAEEAGSPLPPDFRGSTE